MSERLTSSALRVTNGSSAARIFRTARKMLCLVALVRRLSVCPISSIDMPSKCRSVNAARSIGLSRSIASTTRSWISALSASRSGSLGPPPCVVTAGASVSSDSASCASSRRGRARIRSIEQLTVIRWSQVPKFARDSNRSSCRTPAEKLPAPRPPRPGRCRSSGAPACRCGGCDGRRGLETRRRPRLVPGRPLQRRSLASVRLRRRPSHTVSPPRRVVVAASRCHASCYGWHAANSRSIPTSSGVTR